MVRQPCNQHDFTHTNLMPKHRCKYEGVALYKDLWVAHVVTSVHTHAL